MEALRRVKAATVEKRLLDANGATRTSSSSSTCSTRRASTPASRCAAGEGRARALRGLHREGPGAPRLRAAPRGSARGVSADAGRSGRAAALHRTLLHDVRLHVHRLPVALPAAADGALPDPRPRRLEGDRRALPRHAHLRLGALGPDHGCPRRPHRQAPHAAGDERRDRRLLARLRREPQLLGAARARLLPRPLLVGAALGRPPPT